MAKRTPKIERPIINSHSLFRNDISYGRDIAMPKGTNVNGIAHISAILPSGIFERLLPVIEGATL